MESLKKCKDDLSLQNKKPQKMMSFLQTVTQNPIFTTEMLQKRDLDFGKKRRLWSSKDMEEEKKNSRNKLGLDCSTSNALTTMSMFLSSSSCIPDGFEEFVPLIDLGTRSARLLSIDLMATCSLIANQSSEKCIDKTDCEAGVGLEKDFVGLSNMDQVFTKET